MSMETDLGTDSIEETLRRARIGARYRKKEMRLRDYGTLGIEVANNLASIQTQLKSNRGVWLVGKTPQALDVFYILCRKCRLSGFDIGVFDIAEFARLLEIPSDPEVDRDDCQTLNMFGAVGIAGIYSRDFKGKPPYEGRVNLDIIWQVRKFLKEDRPVLFYATGTPDESALWWGEDFARFIGDVCLVIEEPVKAVNSK